MKEWTMRGWPLLLTLLLTTGLMAPAFGAPRDDDEDDEGGTTVVTSRGPEKKGLQVRSKFFRKKGRIEITPNFGYITNNEFNQDMSGGLDVAIHLSERFALEFGGLYAFLGANNQKDLAAAVLSLTDPNMLEATDPGVFAHVGILWSPMYGKINPMGMAVINLDFFLALGLGYEYEEVEILQMDWTTGKGAVNEKFQNHLVPLHLGVGMKIFASRGFSLRIDGRFYLTIDQILDFKDPRSAQANRNLLNDNQYTNRLDCGANSSAQCVTTLNNTFIVSVGGSIWAPKMKTED
jgi:outer membrane beta-barrel protein